MLHITRMCRTLHPPSRGQPPPPLRPRPAAGAAAAFSLVELLAVIAVLALLAATGAAAFGRARAMAQEAACKGNLRQWGVAFLAYAADHEGRLPHGDDRGRADKSGLADSPHDHSYVDELPPAYMGARAWRDHPEGGKPADGFWQCPAARIRGDEEYNYAPSRHGYHSYAMNAYLAQDFDYGLAGRSNQPSYLNLLRCEAPSRTILMFEQMVDPRDNVFGGKYAIRDAGKYTAEDATALTVRHRRLLGGEGGNVLFLDGHVAWRDDVWARTKSDVPAPDDLEWYPYLF